MTRRSLLDEAERRLRQDGVPESRASAEFLMAAVLGVKRGELMALGGETIAERERLRYRRMVLRRGRREPLAYILGTQAFMGLELLVTPDVLIPRPETEEVVEAAAELARAGASGRPLRALDLGTGSGCIALALAARFPDSFIVAVDTSRAALALAAENARRLRLDGRVRFVHGDFFKPVSGASAGWADLVVSNPPYVPSVRIAELAPEVRREPVLALDGGKDGLEAVRAVVAEAPRALRPGGRLVLEIDEGLGARVRALMERRGFEGVEVRRDLGGLERIAFGRYTGK